MTVIGRGIRLILLDCFETLVHLVGDRYQARKGTAHFLEHFSKRQGVPCVVVSDGTHEAVSVALTQAKLVGDVSAIYHAGNAQESFPDGRVRKRLDRPLADFRIAAKDAVFISDSKLDQVASLHYHVPFIRIPRSEDQAFSFESLITGPSQYRSGEFELDFLKHYGKGPQP